MKENMWEQFDMRLGELFDWVQEEKNKALRTERSSVDRRKKMDRRDQNHAR